MITSYDGFCTVLSFDQDELGIPFSSQPAQINSPRLLLRPELKSKKKKKSSPKNSQKKNSELENEDPQPNSVQPNSTPSDVVPMEVKESQPHEPCVTPKRQNGLESARKELLTSDNVVNNHVVNNHAVNNHVVMNHAVNNHVVSSTKESETVVKRITPVKVSEVQKSRESTPTNVVEMATSGNSDSVNNKPISKPSRRIALTKIE